MPASTVQTTAPNRRIITRSGITLTTLHVPKPRSKVSPIEWVHRSDDSRPPFDWESIGLGKNYAFEDEVFRGHLPMQLGDGLPFEDWFVPSLPVFFSPKGVSMKEILLWDPNVPQSAPRGVPIQWTDKVNAPLQDFWLRLRWPGAKWQMNQRISHDTTFGSIAKAVATAYKKFLENEAKIHDWEEYTSGPWHAANIDFSTLRLQSLFWVGQTEETGWVPGETIRVDIYEAQVDLVFNLPELDNQLALFLSRQS